MTLTQLKYVITIADTGSMNEAAKLLFISQPSLSLALKELENEIGTELFKRSNRGVVLTPEGQEFLGYARQVTEQYKLMESRYIEKKNVKKKFGVSMQHYTFAVNAFIEMVKQFGMDEYEFAVREEKTYEVIEAINRQSTAGLQEELGDVLLQVALHAQMEAEAGHFDFNDVADGICKKLIFRHPHVFGDVKAENTDDALASWDAAKLKEKGMKKVSQSMVSIPRELPALMRAQKVQHKAAKQGFDWPDCSGAMDKLDEEINELKIALDQGEPTSIADEFGDVLFSCVNIARFIGVDSEEALTAATDKFLSRYVLVEQLAAERGMEMKSSSLQALDALWDEAKQILSDQSEMEEM